MNFPRSKNVSKSKVSEAKAKKSTASEASRVQKKPQSRSNKNFSLNRRVPERISVDDEKIPTFAVEPAVHQACLPLAPLFRLPVGVNHDLAQPNLQSSLPLLATIDVLKSCPSLDRQQCVGNTLLKAQGSVSSVAPERKIFHDLKPIRVNSEIIDKKMHHYSSSAAGNAPIAVGSPKEKDAGHLEYPFKIEPKHSVEFSSFNQFTTAYGIKLFADATLPADCCVSIAMKDLC